MELTWIVFIEDINTRKIEHYNVFDHGRFMKDLVDIKKRIGKDEGFFPQFAAEVKSSLMYYFWSKCEWEVVITSWPPYVNGKEIDRLADEKTNCLIDYGRFVRTYVNLEAAEKIDVFDQVMMNWDQFIDYLWRNRHLIKLPK